MTLSKDKYKEGDAITWLQVHNLFPVLTSVITIVGAFYMLQSRIDLVAQRQNVIETTISACQARVGVLEEKHTDAALKIQELLTKDSLSRVKGVSTTTPSPLDK